jgi:hypothetical protein
MGVTAAIVATAAVVGTGYQVYAGEKAASEAKDQRKDTERKAREAQAQIEESERNKAKVASDAARRQAQKAAGAYGRSDTILTGPMGLGSDTSSGSRGTLLGG